MADFKATVRPTRKRPEPEPEQLELNLGPHVLVPQWVYDMIREVVEEEALKCCSGVVARYGQDEYRCGKCGVIWGIDEPRPPCQGDA